jgi:hypothetical protein
MDRVRSLAKPALLIHKYRALKYSVQFRMPDV